MVKSYSRKKSHPLLRAAGVRQAILLTDAERLDDPVALFSRLPRGSIIIFRHYGVQKRHAFAQSLRQQARRFGHQLLISGDDQLSIRTGTGRHAKDGHIMPKRGALQPTTAAAHTRQALHRAEIGGADIALVSPVFPTQSHKGAQGLDIHRFARLIRHSSIGIAALGGVNNRTAKRLRGIPGVKAVAAIDGWKQQ